MSQNLSDIRSSSNVHRKFDYCPPYTSSCTRPDPASSRLAVGYIDADYITSTSREQRYIERGNLAVARCRRSTRIHTGPLRTSSRCLPPCNVWCSCLACLCLSCRGILETDVASCLSHTGHSMILNMGEILVIWCLMGSNFARRGIVIVIELHVELQKKVWYLSKPLLEWLGLEERNHL